MSPNGKGAAVSGAESKPGLSVRVFPVLDRSASCDDRVVSRSDPVIRRGCAAAVVLFAALTAAVGESQGAPTRFLVIDTTGALTFVAAGLIAWERRPEVRSGPVLLACAALWSVGTYAPTSLVPWALLGFAFERYYDLLLAFLVLTFPDVRLARSDRLLLGVMAGGYITRTASRLLVQCDCTSYDNPFALVEQRTLFEQAQVLPSAVIFGAALVVAARAVLRLIHAAPAVRRILWPVVASGSVAALVAAYDAAELIAFVRTGRPLLPFGEPWLEISSWTITAAVVLVALGFLTGAMRLRLRHGVIARMAIEVDRGTDPQRRRAALRHAFGDPRLDLYLRNDNAVWTTTSGAPTVLPGNNGDSAVTVLTSSDEPIAAIIHDRTLREDPGLIAAATAVLRLAFENERLAGVVRGQLEEVRASRMRLIQTGEQERRRIERDLHDGAQQRLIAVALTLQQAREEARSVDAQAVFVHLLDDAAEELVAAVDELRELARGIHPAILTEVGLRPAVAGLARRSAVPADLDIQLTDRLEPGVEAAAYFIIAEALTNVSRHARASAATVHIARNNDRLEVEVTDDGAGGADRSRGSGLDGIADRLDAMSGTLVMDSPAGGGTRLRAGIPCG